VEAVLFVLIAWTPNQKSAGANSEGADYTLSWSAGLRFMKGVDDLNTEVYRHFELEGIRILF
jgi:hypothetical protein